MKYNKIDGVVFEKMMRNALKNIRLHEREINDLNVFPVPDGDTGTNMRRTVELGVETAHTNKKLGEYLKELSSGMLLGARGNSGVILSQIFKGFAETLSRYDSADAGNLTVAFIKGYIAAYSSVMRPVEGTILTVVREGIERTKKQVYWRTTVDTMMSIYLSEMHKTLAETPNLLPVLKEAGVVDSGGYGYIVIVSGMLKALYNEEIELPAGVEEPHDAPAIVDDSAFGVNSPFEYGYCMEFLLQLLNKKGSVKKFNVNDYIEEIKLYGNSLVVIQDKFRVKVHIHTLKPEKVISISREHGEFITFKLENMQLQHNEFVAVKQQKEQPRKEVAVLAVADGNGFISVFKEQGADMVINGGRTMSTSVKEFLDAYKALNADKVVVLPNDKNIVYAAKQAAEMAKGCTVEILETTSQVQGYVALASDMSDRPFDERIASMKEGFFGVSTVSVRKASKNRNVSGVECKAGEYVAFLDGKLITCDKELTVAAVNAVNAVKDIEDKEQLIVFTGENADGADKLIEKLESVFTGLEIDVANGGQASEEIIIGIF